MNSRLDTLQAAILLSKLEILDDELAARQCVAETYGSLFAPLSLHGTGAGEEGAKPIVAVPYVEPRNTSAWAQYTIRVRDRPSVQKVLHGAGIPTVIHYPLPLNRQPAVANTSATLPHGDLAAEQVLSVPMHPYLGEPEISKICLALQQT